MVKVLGMQAPAEGCSRAMSPYRPPNEFLSTAYAPGSYAAPPYAPPVFPVRRFHPPSGCAPRPDLPRGAGRHPVRPGGGAGAAHRLCQLGGGDAGPAQEQHHRSLGRAFAARQRSGLGAEPDPDHHLARSGRHRGGPAEAHRRSRIQSRPGPAQPGPAGGRDAGAAQSRETGSKATCPPPAAWSATG